MHENEWRRTTTKRSLSCNRINRDQILIHWDGRPAFDLLYQVIHDLLWLNPKMTSSTYRKFHQLTITGMGWAFGYPYLSGGSRVDALPSPAMESPEAPFVGGRGGRLLLMNCMVPRGVSHSTVHTPGLMGMRSGSTSASDSIYAGVWKKLAMKCKEKYKKISKIQNNEYNLFSKCTIFRYQCSVLLVIFP